MAPHDDSDWSDSDDDSLSEIETAVLLGLPDDAIEKKGDIDDAAVSRIGGYPVRRLAFIPLDRVPNSNILFFIALAVSFPQSNLFVQPRNVQAFLTSTEPPLSSALCKICLCPMELLVQLWCPFEESSMDRALYVFGCAQSSCQRKEGRYVVVSRHFCYTSH